MGNHPILASEAHAIAPDISGAGDGYQETALAARRQTGHLNQRASGRQKPASAIVDEDDRRELVHRRTARWISNDTAHRQLVAPAFVPQGDELERRSGW
jgi:hypothetical protein